MRVRIGGMLFAIALTSLTATAFASSKCSPMMPPLSWYGAPVETKNAVVKVLASSEYRLLDGLEGYLAIKRSPVGIRSNAEPFFERYTEDELYEAVMTLSFTGLKCDEAVGCPCLYAKAILKEMWGILAGFCSSEKGCRFLVEKAKDKTLQDDRREYAFYALCFAHPVNAGFVESEILNAYGAFNEFEKKRFVSEVLRVLSRSGGQKSLKFLSGLRDQDFVDKSMREPEINDSRKRIEQRLRKE